MINDAIFNRNVLSEVNGYLKEELDKLEGKWKKLQRTALHPSTSDLISQKREEFQKKLDALSQEILEFGETAFSQNKKFYVAVTFVDLTIKIASLAKREDPFGYHFNSKGQNLALKKTRDIAVSFFSPNGNNIDGNKLCERLIRIKILNELDKEISYRALSNWIHTYKIPLHELEIDPSEYLELAPYLTFLHFDEERMRGQMSEKEMINFITKAVNVRILIVKNILNPCSLDKFQSWDNLEVLSTEVVWKKKIGIRGDDVKLHRRFINSRLGREWLKHNFMEIVNTEHVLGAIIGRIESGFIYKLFIDNLQKLTETNWNLFRDFLSDDLVLRAIFMGSRGEPEVLNFRNILLKADPALLIRLFYLFPGMAIVDKEKLLINEYLRSDDAKQKIIRNQNSLIFMLLMIPSLRSTLFEIYPEQVKKYFLSLYSFSFLVDYKVAYREFIQTKVGADWVEQDLLSTLTLSNLSGVTFDQYPHLLKRVEDFLATDGAEKYIKDNYKLLLDGCFSFREIISKKHPELLLRYVLEGNKELSNPPKAITKSELDTMIQFAKTSEGIEWIGDNMNLILSRDDLRRIVWVSHPLSIKDYFITKLKAVPTEEERALLISLLQTKKVSVQMKLGDILNPHLREICAEVYPERLIECYLKEVLFFPLTSRDRIILIKFISAPEGRAMIQANPPSFIDHNILRPFLLQIYPPTDPNNRDLYPIRVRKEVHTLNIEIYPSMPLYQPDVILQAMLDNRPITRIRIMHYGSPAIDASGLSKQFLSQLMQGLPKSKLLPFEKTESGFLQPRDTGMPLSNIQEQAFGLLGHIFAMAIKRGYPIGTVFSPELIQALYIGSSPFETTRGMNLAERLRYIKQTYDHELPENEANHPYALMKIICEGDHEEEILMAASKLNDLWDSESIKEAIGTKDLLKLQNLVVDTWFSEHKRYYDTLKVVAVGMMAELPFSIAGLTINQWQDLENVSPEQFSIALQGKLSAEEIKANLVFERDAQIAQAVEEERRAWFFEWIDAHKDNREMLANFIQGFTGGTAMAGPLTIRLTTNVDGLFPHSCFNAADLHPDLNKESLFYEFNEFAEGRGVNFTRL